MSFDPLDRSRVQAQSLRSRVGNHSSLPRHITPLDHPSSQLLASVHTHFHVTRLSSCCSSQPREHATEEPNHRLQTTDAAPDASRHPTFLCFR